MKIVDMTVGMQVIGKETATIYKVIQIPNPGSGVALLERENGRRQYINASCLMPLTQYHDTICLQERDRWLKWLNHYAMGQPAMNIINNHSIYSQVFIIPIEDLRERFE